MKDRNNSTNKLTNKTKPTAHSTTQHNMAKQNKTKQNKALIT